MADPGTLEERRKQRSRRIAAGYGLATLFSGAALGGIYGLASGNWKQGGTWLELWITVALVVLALVALGVALAARRRQDREDRLEADRARRREETIRQRGVAYVVREDAAGWDKDDPAGFYAQVRESFSDFVPVPGPGETGRTWKWPLVDGAKDWDARVTDLVRAFRAVTESTRLRYQEEKLPRAAEGIFVTAWWPVALAFAKRLRGGVRGREYDVWQRPSDGRTGPVSPDTETQRPHRFPDEPVSVPGTLDVHPDIEWTADLTVTRPPGTGKPLPGGPLTVLFIRFLPQPWGRLALTDPPQSAEPLEFLDAGAVLSARGTSRVTVHELRCLRRDGDEHHRWEDFPVLAGLAVDWIQKKTADAERDDGTVILGMNVPNEVALGIGIRAGRASCDGWPARMWPVNWDRDRKALVTARLSLGDDGLVNRPGKG